MRRTGVASCLSFFLWRAVVQRRKRGRLHGSRSSVEGFSPDEWTRAVEATPKNAQRDEFRVDDVHVRPGPLLGDSRRGGCHQSSQSGVVVLLLNPECEIAFAD